MNKLFETDFKNFKETKSKRNLENIIDVLVKYGHVDVEEINHKDEELGTVWNWLNKLAESSDWSSIIKYLKRLHLFAESMDMRERNILINEAYSDIDKFKMRHSTIYNTPNQTAIGVKVLPIYKKIILQAFDNIEWVPYKTTNIALGKFVGKSKYGGEFELVLKSKTGILAAYDGKSENAVTEFKELNGKEMNRLGMWIKEHIATDETFTEINTSMYEEIKHEMLTWIASAKWYTMISKEDKHAYADASANPEVASMLQHLPTVKDKPKAIGRIYCDETTSKNLILHFYFNDDNVINVLFENLDKRTYIPCKNIEHLSAIINKHCVIKDIIAEKPKLLKLAIAKEHILNK